MLVFRAREEMGLYEFMATLMNAEDAKRKNAVLDEYREIRFPFVEVSAPSEDTMKKTMDKLFMDDTIYEIDPQQVDMSKARVSNLKRKLRR